MKIRKNYRKTVDTNFLENCFLNPKDYTANTDNSLLDSALHYASLGCRVFPVYSMVTKGQKLVCSCSKSMDCDAQGKHPANWNGLRGGTTDKEQIRKWWAKNPTANIGLLTGKESGFFVLDIDPKDGGEYSLQELEEFHRDALEERYEPLPATLTAMTGPGGRHLFFRYPNFLVKGSVSAVGSGLDVRAEGNYVVAPPSNHKSGKAYEWHGVDTPILEAPLWLKRDIILASYVFESDPSTQNKVMKRAEKIKDGEGRHDNFWRTVCGFVNNRTEAQALELALRWNEENLDPPKDERYVRAQVKYLYKRYSKRDGRDMGLRA